MKKFSLIIYLLFFFIYMEIVFNRVFFVNLNLISLLRIALFSVAITFLVYLISSFFSKRAKKIIVTIILLLSTVIYISQFIFFKIYDNIFSFNTTDQAGAVGEYFGFVIQKITENSLQTILFTIPLIIYLVLMIKNLISFEKIRVIYKPALILAVIFFQTTALLTLSKGEMYSSYNLYHNTQSTKLMTAEFGLLTTMRIDTQRMIWGFEERKEFLDVIEEEKEEEENVEITVEYNEMEIDFESLIANETDETVKELHQYFSTQSPTNKNEKTGLFEGKNLIWILAESFDSIAIDQEITPNLYKMATEGFNFTNFYTPIFLSTIDGEYMTKTGLLPKESVWSMFESRNNHLPFALGNQFKNLEYRTLGYHNGQATYYKRNQSHPNLGYDWYGCGQGLQINCKLWPQSDLEMIDATAPNFINNDPFMVYYLTISGHLRHNQYNYMALKNWSKVKHLQYSDSIKYYMAQHIELDNAIGNLIKYLEEIGVAEETVIAISSDHWPYGLTLEEMNEKSNFERDDFFDRDKLPFVIWHKGIEGEQVNKLSSSLDIMPTLSNLFGLEYDSRLMVGKDIFSDSDPLVIFSDRSWITEKGKYNNETEEFQPAKKVDNEYIENTKKIVFNKFEVSARVLDLDYYRKVFER